MFILIWLKLSSVSLRCLSFYLEHSILGCQCSTGECHSSHMPLFSETNLGVKEGDIKTTPIQCKYINLLYIHRFPQEMGYYIRCRWMFSLPVWTENLIVKKPRLRDNSPCSQWERMHWVKIWLLMAFSLVLLWQLEGTQYRKQTISL